MREAYGRLYAEFAGQGFHCAHGVLQRLPHLSPVSRDLLDGTCGFIGGTLFKGLTCSAFVAGVMAAGLAKAEIETSRLRVMRLIALLLTHGDALADKINKFNKLMNLGNRISSWFAEEFGSIQCRVLTGTDFSTNAGVNEFVKTDGLRRCRAIAEKVAAKVQDAVSA